MIRLESKVGLLLLALLRGEKSSNEEALPVSDKVGAVMIDGVSNRSNSLVSTSTVGGTLDTTSSSS